MLACKSDSQFPWFCCNPWGLPWSGTGHSQSNVAPGMQTLMRLPPAMTLAGARLARGSNRHRQLKSL